MRLSELVQTKQHRQPHQFYLSTKVLIAVLIMKINTAVIAVIVNIAIPFHFFI